jgi:hypothetical protein
MDTRRSRCAAGAPIARRAAVGVAQVAVAVAQVAVAQEQPMTPSSQGPADAADPIAPLGGPAEPETPVHTTDLDATADAPVEDAAAYELAVEDGAPLPATGEDPGAGPLAPEFREPGRS